jgi:quinol monooxygenase YgiN
MPDTPLTIVAEFHARPEKIEDLKKELLTLVPPVLEEDGCLQYDLHQDLDDPTVLFFYENWRDRASWEKHMEQPYIQALGGKADELLTAPVRILKMQKLLP